MTNREFLKTETFRALNLMLEKYNYKLLKSKDSFILKTDFGWNRYSIDFFLRDIGWTILPALLVRFEVVENLYHKISDFEKKYQKGTPTIGTTIENFDVTLEARFDLYEESQINSVVEKLFELFENVALPFFGKFSNLSAIDEQLNYNINDTTLTGGIFKGTKSLIIGKLMKRNDFDELERVYQSYYISFADGFYLPEYLRLKELLKSNA